MVVVKPPKIAKSILKDIIWSIPNNDNKIYLTFDDGPTPGITEYLLNVLDKYNIKATFFCLGKNVSLYPELYQQLLNKGHAVGNHTCSHLNGWKTNNNTYVDDIYKAKKIINSKVFRPPYGKIKPSQIKLIKNDFRIIMWSTLSGDYNQNLSCSQIIDNVINNVESGSIIVFHDSVKAEKNLRNTIDPIISELLKKYKFDVVS